MSVAVFTPTENAVTISDTAKAFFRKKIAKQDYPAIRISVKKSGCTGYAYVIDYGKEKAEGDSEHIFDDITLFISEKAMEMIKGSHIDLKKEGLNQSIVFDNPNVTASCGCGSSFTTD
ncbi:MAG: iron-sulfur cluster assembly accessory protein [Moraxellaceae bacterium]|nr:iron-sulfur cluster assembly accessory protein [Moraxellaceae bacterium]